MTVQCCPACGARWCPVCDAPVPAQTGRGRPRVYCSDRCTERAWNDRRRQRRRSQPWATEEEIMAGLASLEDPDFSG